MVGLVIGRFQPFHNGHLRMIRWIMKREDRIIVGIGSAQESHTLRDPFTAGERYEMIHEALKEADISDFFIIPIEDLKRNSMWVAHVMSLSPKFDVVYTNNPLVKELFEEYDIRVICPPIYKRDALTGRKIRELMVEENGWEKYVPHSVSDVIDRVGGVRRMKNIARSDEIEG